MELFEDDQARESKDGDQKSESRTSTPSRHGTSRSRKTGKMSKKRHVGRTRPSRTRHAKKRIPALAVPSRGTSPAPTPVRPEPPPIIPQPTLDSPEEEPSEPEEPREEPPPPSASANTRDGDDLFEYVF